MTTYSYTKSPLSIDRLTLEIRSSTISIALDHISSLGAAVDVVFKADLSDTDKTTLDALIAAHTGIPLSSESQPVQITSSSGVILNQYDTDNALIIRQKAAKSGWTYGAVAFEFSTSSNNGVTALNFDTTGKTWITATYFDAFGTVITNPLLLSDCVRTQVDFEPPYDYELIGGEMRLSTQILTDMRLFIIAVPDIPAPSGSKVMAEGLNLKYLYPGNLFQVDGRVSKLLTYNATYHTNKLRFLLWHTPGVVENIMITVELYRS